ncbi:MAG: dockerin type I domain-containing protein [Oscillospiraceae bacterium]|nr:dockerin type I domain-containing protein [Oscillospiraceae bacterium]
MKGKIISLLCAAAFCASCLSGAFVHPVSAESIVYERYSMSRMEEVLADFEKQTEQKNNEEGVTEGYAAIVEEYDYVIFQYSLAQVQFSENMTDENYDELTYMNAMQLECLQKINEVINRAVNSEYQELMTEFTGINVTTGEIKDEQAERESAAAAEKSALIKQYNEAAYSSKSSSDKDLECAEIYLKLVKLNNSIVNREKYDNYFDYMYDVYGRDYSSDEIKQINSSVSGLMDDADRELTDRLNTLKNKMLTDKNAKLVFENNMEIAQQYAYRISEELSVSASEALEKGLYITGSGSDSEQAAYTTMLSYCNSAIIYQYLYGNYNDLTSALHEFGHFNAMRLSCIPSLYINRHNIDVAEVQSQGLEVLYTQFYESIYGEYAETMRLMEAMSLIRSVAAGFIGNEFEDYVYENAENLTAEDVVSKYNEISSRYKFYNVNFYRITHFFVSPGYYISYAVSALAALNLWDVMYSDPELAVSMYNDFSHYPTWGPTGFSEALDTAGFENVLSTEFIESGVTEFLSVLASGQIYGDTDGNGLINTGDFITLVHHIVSPEDGADESACDLNRDGKTDISDLMLMKKLMLK